MEYLLYLFCLGMWNARLFICIANLGTRWITRFYKY